MLSEDSNTGPIEVPKEVVEAYNRAGEPISGAGFVHLIVALAISVLAGALTYVFLKNPMHAAAAFAFAALSYMAGLLFNTRRNLVSPEPPPYKERNWPKAA